MSWSFTLQNVLLGAAVLGFAGGILGGFAFLRKQSLMSDSVAHATLPGVCLAFLATGSKASLPLLAGALVSGVAGALVVHGVSRYTRIKDDAAMGIVLSVFFGVGIVLLTRIQKLPGGDQSGLDRFLFGQAATLLPQDVTLLSVAAAAVLAVVALLFKELKLVTFDPAFAATRGLPVRWLELLFAGLLTIVVVLGLQMVGVVLVVATLLIPPVTARQWTDRLGPMLLLAGALGAVTGAAGAALSAMVPRLPTGPTIVVLSSAVLVASLLAAPRRGILAARARATRLRARVEDENLLCDLYRLGEESGDRRSVPLATLLGIRGRQAAETRRGLRRLERRGSVVRSGDTATLTPEGLELAGRLVRKHRLWELYLSSRLDLPADHLHRDAEAMEHALSDAFADEIDRRLGFPARDPHGRPIPRGSRP